MSERRGGLSILPQAYHGNMSLNNSYILTSLVPREKNIFCMNYFNEILFKKLDHVPSPLRVNMLRSCVCARSTSETARL